MKIELVKSIKAPLIAEPFCEEWVKKSQLLPIKSGDFKGELKQSFLVFEGSSRRLLIGLGKEKQCNLETVRKAVADVVAEAKKLKLTELAYIFKPVRGVNNEDHLAALAEASVLANYEFDKYMSEKKKSLKRFSILTSLPFSQKIKNASRIAENVNLLRDNINEMSYEMTPAGMEKLARKIASESGLKITVLDQKKLAEKGLNLVLAVGQGSRYPPRLIIAEYQGDSNSKKKIALVGKGVTFDTGGLNLKTTGFIETMRMDKGGALTVISVLKTASELKLKKNIVGVMACVENMISPTSYKPGDIFRSYSGKTVEILNTDAEGRLILADALAYVEKNYKPSLIIDFATLTGAALIIFGELIAPAMGTDREAIKKLLEAGKKTNERVWELPLDPEFSEETKSDIADVKNIGYRGMFGYYAGTIMGGSFLNHFVDKTPWIHIDIAGTAWYERDRGYVKKRATGFGLRLIMEFLEME